MSATVGNELESSRRRGFGRGLPPEVLETLGLDPEGDEDEPDEPSGPYELPHRIAEFSPPTARRTGVAGYAGGLVTSRLARARVPATIRRVARSFFRTVLALEDTRSTELRNATCGQPYEAKCWIEVCGGRARGLEQQHVNRSDRVSGSSRSAWARRIPITHDRAA